MCGIAAIFAYKDDSPVAREELIRIRDSMITRGPDSAGEWFSPNGQVALGHRRLSIIDLSEKAAQPMLSSGGHCVISFNGEIYNYKELRKALEVKGCRFFSHSDTEVLLHLYKEKGERMLEELRGMFAFALWDGDKKAMFLARDPYGIKPLYYADDGRTLRVSSQVKALLASPKVSRIKEPAGIVGFFLYGNVPEPYTFYQEIHAVPAGSFLWVDGRGLSKPTRYFSIAQIYSEAKASQGKLHRAEIPERLRDALRESIRYHFTSDVPVSIFLSSGIDSGSLVGLAKDVGIKDITTITLKFVEFSGHENDESLLAEEVSRTYDTKHFTCQIEKSAVKNALADIVEVMDQPTIDGINTYLISMLASKMGFKVALSGLGGDELFGGYPSFRDIPRWVRTTAVFASIPFFGYLSRRLISSLIPDGVSPKISGLIEYGSAYEGAYLLRRGLFMPWEIPALIGEEQAAAGMKKLDPLRSIRSQLQPDPSTDFGRVASMESTMYLRNQLLRDADWAGMAHSLEIRVPFVDIHLLKKIAPLLLSLNGGGGKNLLAQTPSSPLPHKVLNRKKTGFSVPMNEWLKSDTTFDSWKKVKNLARSGCHWSRRWAYTVYEQTCT